MLLRNLQKRLINHEKWIDYFILFVIALLPIIISPWIGVHKTINVDGHSFKGYWDRFNWTSLVLFTPFSLFCLRWIVKFLFGSISKSSSDHNEVRLVCFFKEEEKGVQKKISSQLSKIALDYKISLTVLFFDVIFNIADSQKTIGHYIAYFKHSNYSINFEKSELDWSTFFLISDNNIKVNVYKNLFFNIIAYSNQFIIVFICWSLILFIFRYNWFYLQKIYQKSKIRVEDAKYYIRLNFEDANQRFGLKILNPTFNVQILTLAVFGVGLLASRYSNISNRSAQPFKTIINCLLSSFGLLFSGEIFSGDTCRIDQCIERLQKIPLQELFPDVGQIIIAIAWMFLSFMIVGLPACVKFLPLFSWLRNHKIALNITDYLGEFVTQSISDTSGAEIEDLAKKFRNNSFWPGGDGIATLLLWIAFIVFFIMFSPIDLSFNNPDILSDVVYVFIVSLLVTLISLFLLKIPLLIVDYRLVKWFW